MYLQMTDSKKNPLIFLVSLLRFSTDLNKKSSSKKSRSRRLAKRSFKMKRKEEQLQLPLLPRKSLASKPKKKSMRMTRKTISLKDHHLSQNLT